MDYRDFFYTLENYGMLDALLPFLLIFIIIFATLQKSNILGKGKKNFNIMIAMIFGLLVVIPHITNSYPPEVYMIRDAISQIFARFLELDLRNGEIRKKSDAIKWNMKKVEDIIYDLKTKRI